MRWSQSTKRLLSLALLLPALVHAAGAGGTGQGQTEDPLAAARTLGTAGAQNYRQQFGGRNASEKLGKPLLTGGASFTTVDGKQSFAANISSPSSSSFLDVMVQQTGSGDVQIVFARFDSDMNGQADTELGAVPLVSGVCANGYISCEPGTWKNCRYLRWDADSSGVPTLQGLDPKKPLNPSELAACYCINTSCGRNLAATNLSIVSGNLGGGIVAAIQKKRPQLAITGVQNEGPLVTYFGSDPSRAATAESPAVAPVMEQQSSIQQLASAYSMGAGGAGMLTGMAESLLGSPEVKAANSPYNAMLAMKLNQRRQSCFIERVGAVDSSENLCIDPIPENELFERIERRKFKVLIGTYRGGNDGWCGNAGGCPPFPYSPSIPTGPTSAIVAASAMRGFESRGVGNENFRDKGKKSGWDDFTYDQYTYYEQCVRVYDAFTEGTNNTCSALDGEKDCVIEQETVDGVSTVMGGLPTGLAPEPSSKVFVGQAGSHTVTRSWWKKDRTYLCTDPAKYDFSEARARYKTITKGIEENGNTLSYSDRVNGATVAGSSFSLPDIPRPDDCQKACKTRKQVENTSVTIGGPRTITNARSAVSYETRFRECAPDDRCPAEEGEEIVKDCQCIDSYAESIAVLQSIKEAGDNITCSKD